MESRSSFFFFWLKYFDLLMYYFLLTVYQVIFLECETLPCAVRKYCLINHTQLRWSSVVSYFRRSVQLVFSIFGIQMVFEWSAIPYEFRGTDKFLFFFLICTVLRVILS